jgi:hypothetical protein
MAIDGLLSACQDQETMDILESAKDQLVPEIETKMVSILNYIGDCTGRIDYLKNEINRLQAKVKSLTKKKDFLKDLAYQHMERTERSSAEYGTYTLSIAKTPAKVVLNEEELCWLPKDLCTTTVVPNKTAIKEAMIGGRLTVVVDGQEIELARMESGTTLRIK